MNFISLLLPRLLLVLRFYFIFISFVCSHMLTYIYRNPEETRNQLEKWLPENLWNDVGLLLVGFGQSENFLNFKPLFLVWLSTCNLSQTQQFARQNNRTVTSVWTTSCVRQRSRSHHHRWSDRKTEANPPRRRSERTQPTKIPCERWKLINWVVIITSSLSSSALSGENWIIYLLVKLEK